MLRKILKILCILSGIGLVLMLLLTAIAFTVGPVLAAVLMSLLTMGNGPDSLGQVDLSGYWTSPGFYATLACALVFTGSLAALLGKKKKN